MRRWKGSYTVEAALIVPLVIGAMALAMRISIMLYEEVCTQKEQETVVAMWEVKEFYRCQAWKEVAND